MTYTCPLCDWTLESEVARMRRPDNLAAAPGVAAALGVPTDAMLSIHENACRRRDEHELEQHLSTHGPKDWLPALTAALDACACDVFLTIGTSAVVYPAAGFVDEAKRRGAFTVEINTDETAASHPVDLCIREAAETVLPRLMPR